MLTPKFIKSFAVAAVSLLASGVATVEAKQKYPDFNGDGQADILFMKTDGTASMWIMGLNTENWWNPKEAKIILDGSFGWKPKFTCNCQGNGKSSILWQSNGGGWALWTMDGTAQTGGGRLFTDAAGQGWAVKLIADVDGDGDDDIVWQHTDGRVGLWIMQNGVQVSGIGLKPAGSGWTPKLAADFNGDGRDDIVYEHTDGRTQMDLMNGITVIGGGQLLGGGTGWHPKLAGDFDGNGKADILWEHNDGSSALWMMNGSTQVGGGRLFGAGTGWLAKSIGDLNGDGKDDILWERDNGELAFWIMNGFTIAGGARIPVPSPSKIYGVGRYISNAATTVPGGNGNKYYEFLTQSTTDGSIRFYESFDGTYNGISSAEILGAQTPGQVYTPIQ